MQAMTDNASNNKHPAADPRPVPLWMKWAGGVAAVLALLVLMVVLFPWDLLRGPLNRYVSDKTGRHFEITRKLDVKLGRTTRILADGIEFANPQWAQDRHLVTAQAAEIDIRLWPLLQGRVVLPMVKLTQPKIGLQVEADGRRSWALGRDTSDPSNLPDIGALVVDEGSVHYLATHQGADILTDFVISESMAPSIAVSATATGAASGALPRASSPGAPGKASLHRRRPHRQCRLSQRAAQESVPGAGQGDGGWHHPHSRRFHRQPADAGRCQCRFHAARRQPGRPVQAGGRCAAGDLALLPGRPPVNL